MPGEISKSLIAQIKDELGDHGRRLFSNDEVIYNRLNGVQVYFMSNFLTSRRDFSVNLIDNVYEYELNARVMTVTDLTINGVEVAGYEFGDSSLYGHLVKSITLRAEELRGISSSDAGFGASAVKDYFKVGSGMILEGRFEQDGVDDPVLVKSFDVSVYNDSIAITSERVSERVYKVRISGIEDADADKVWLSFTRLSGNEIDTITIEEDNGDIVIRVKTAMGVGGDPAEKLSAMIQVGGYFLFRGGDRMRVRCYIKPVVDDIVSGGSVIYGSDKLSATVDPVIEGEYHRCMIDFFLSRYRELDSSFMKSEDVVVMLKQIRDAMYREDRFRINKSGERANKAIRMGF